jgi:hypothetical protein
LKPPHSLTSPTTIGQSPSTGLGVYLHLKFVTPPHNYKANIEKINMNIESKIMIFISNERELNSVLANIFIEG